VEPEELTESSEVAWQVPLQASSAAVATWPSASGEKFDCQPVATNRIPAFGMNAWAMKTTGGEIAGATEKNGLSRRMCARAD